MTNSITPKKSFNKKSFLEQLDAVFSNKLLPLKINDRMVLVAFASKADEKGRCRVSRQQIADYLGIDKDNVSRYLIKFKKLKIITVSKNFQRGTKCMSENTYTIHLNMIVALSITKEGAISVDGSPQIEVTSGQNISLNNNQNMSEGNLNLRLGSPQIEGVKITTQNLNLNQKTIDIVQDQTLDDKKPDHGFDAFWSAYPRKEKKKQAYLIWMKHGLTAKAEQILMDIRDRRLRHDRWDDIAYIPLPTTYLNEESWEDEIIDKNQPKEGMTNGQSGNGSYIDKLKAAATIVNGDANVYPFGEFVGRKVDKQY